MSKCGVFFGRYFSSFGLDTEIYTVNICIESECGKIRTRKNSVFGQFSRSVKDSASYDLLLPGSVEVVEEDTDIPCFMKLSKTAFRETLS